MRKPVVIIKFLVLHFHYCFHWILGYNFDHCYDGFLPYGNCTEVDSDAALGLQSYRSILIRDGYLDTGLRWGCPYSADSCPLGFNFYGWFKFRHYPKSCSDYGILASSKMFSIQILGNGHLSAYTWVDDREWYVRTRQPLLLDIWYPIILQFNYSSISKVGTLSLSVQGQSSAVQHNYRLRTQNSSSEKLVFGGNEAKARSYGIQMDRIFIDSPVRRTSELSDALVNAPILRAYCYGKPYFTLAKDFQCFWLDIWSPKTWKESQEACDKIAYESGYPYGRLAQLLNSATWLAVERKLKFAGSFQAWVGENSTFSNETLGNNSQCLALDAKSKDWKWTYIDCEKKIGRLCEMNWNCMPDNLCENFGACDPMAKHDSFCRCFEGTHGQFCEQGEFNGATANGCSQQNTRTSTIAATSASTVPTSASVGRTVTASMAQAGTTTMPSETTSARSVLVDASAQILSPLSSQQSSTMTRTEVKMEHDRESCSKRVQDLLNAQTTMIKYLKSVSAADTYEIDQIIETTFEALDWPNKDSSDFMRISLNNHRLQRYTKLLKHNYGRGITPELQYVEAKYRSLKESSCLSNIQCKD